MSRRGPSAPPDPKEPRSMVPRFLMPPWLQQLSWITPNAWAIEAYHHILWRNGPPEAVLPLVALLVGLAVLSLVAASIMLRRGLGG